MKIFLVKFELIQQLKNPSVTNGIKGKCNFKFVVTISSFYYTCKHVVKVQKKQKV